MFNRKIELRFVKDRTPQEADKNPTECYNRINSKEAIQELVKYVAVTGIVVLATSVALNVVGAIIIEAVSASKE